jgi:hypothetical protein
MMTPERITTLPEALAVIDAAWRVFHEFDTGDTLDPDGMGHRLRRELGRALAGYRKEPKDSSDGMYVSAFERLRVHEKAVAGIKRMIESREHGFTIHQESALRVWLAGTNR